MKYPDYRWVDTAFGGVDKRNRLREIAKLKVPDNTPDCYRTVFRYPPAMWEHVKGNGSVGGYHGSVYADWLPFDIDNEDLEQAQGLAAALLGRLEALFDVDLAAVPCFFSGAKGFHVLLPQDLIGWEPADNLPQRMRQLALTLTDDISIDTSIYDRVRLFRLSNTRHGKSGLYKVPLYAREVMWTSLKDIQLLAASPRQGVEWSEASQNSALVAAWAATERAEPPRANAPPGTMPQLDRWAKPCIARMLQGGLQQGSRQAVAFRLAVHFRKQGLSGALILSTLREWNTTNVTPLEDSELVHAVEQAVTGQYDFGCHDPLMQQYCNGACLYKRQQEQADESTPSVLVLDIREAQHKYEEYVAQLRQAKVTLGLDKLDEAMRGIAPGETCWIAARAGVGKTAFLLNVLGNNSRQGADSLFCSLEQPAAQIYERATQIAVQATGRDVEQVFIKALIARERGLALPSEYARWPDETRQKFALVRVADADSMGVREVEQAVAEYEKRFGQRPRLLGIDYLGRMDGGAGTPYEVVSRLAKQVKSIAKKLSVAVVVIHQVSREGGDGSQEISINMLRDSGQAEEAADFVIGLWRPDMREAIRNSLSEEIVQAAILKNRKGPLAQTKFMFNKAHMTFRPT